MNAFIIIVAKKVMKKLYPKGVIQELVLCIFFFSSWRVLTIETYSMMEQRGSLRVIGVLLRTFIDLIYHMWNFN